MKKEQAANDARAPRKPARIHAQEECAPLRLLTVTARRNVLTHRANRPATHPVIVHDAHPRVPRYARCTMPQRSR